MISLNKVDLAGAVRADHADDAARRQREAQILEQQFVAIGLGQALDLDDVAAEPLGHLDQDLRLARRAVLLRLDQLVEGADAGLGLGLARLGRAADPFELVVDRLLLALLLALLLLQPLSFLLQIAGIIGFVDVVAAAIELEHPVHDIVEEVAVVGDEDDVAGIVDEMLFEPLHAFGVEMVGRLVEQQDVGLFEQQPGQRDAALLAAREIVDRASPGGQRSASIAISSWLSSVQPSTASIFSWSSPISAISASKSASSADRPSSREIALKRSTMSATGRTAVHDVLLDRLGRIELRLLLQIADA